MTDTPDVQPPKIEFHCEQYPIKVIVDAGEGFSALVVEIIQRHAPALDVETLVVRASSKDRVLSVQRSI
ncbi:DUF493 family protein, partial [Pseudomonas aeruginosa]|uniref:DUF493 family protein n=1 Tax=Pseudomonas aeruginosa TaxID=287 RepID=UPI001C610C17